MNPLAAFFSEDRQLDDWFSPILIKELRQGMRARAFIISFLLIQVFLVVLVLGNIEAQDDRSALDFQNYYFWVIVGFALLGIMPLRSLNSVSLEVKNHTMETILLTRLTAWRVVFGKWSALFAQSLLIVSAVLPFVVLRYFIGGNDLVSDFAWILFMLWFSGVLIAVGIAVSALGNAVVRIIVLITVFSTTVASTNELFTGLLLSGLWQTLGWLLILGFFVPALLFELAVSSIAPASENHALLRRILALLFFIAAGAMTWATHGGFPAGTWLSLIVLIGVCYFELAEKPRLLLRVIHPFSRAGALGRIGSLFLLPGWPSGLLFSLVVIPIAVKLLLLFVFPHASGGPGWLLTICAIFGSILPPILICHLFWPKMKQIPLLVLVYNLVLLGLATVLEGFATLITHSHITSVFAFMPGLPVLTFEMQADKDLLPWFRLGHVLTIVVMLLVLLWGSRSYFREWMALFRAEKLIAPARTIEPGEAS